MYQPRHYRLWVHSPELISFAVSLGETDLLIQASKDLRRQAKRLVRKHRVALEGYIGAHPDFLTSLAPLEVDDCAPQIVRTMSAAAATAGVGPMASVAGAIAEAVGLGLLKFSKEVIIENGGDIFIRSASRRIVAIYAGDSPLSGKLGLEICAENPLGVCTSSGTVGHSLSFGEADAVVVLSPSAALADAAATAVANRVSRPEDIDPALEFGRTISGVTGLFIIKGASFGAWGDVKLCRTETEEKPG